MGPNHASAGLALYGPIHHIKLSARRQLKFSPVTYFFISSSNPQILFLLLQECKHDEHIISLVANGPMLNSGADTFMLLFYPFHSSFMPFLRGTFSRLACDTHRPWLKGFSWASQTLSLCSLGAHQLTNPMQIRRILIFTFTFLTKYPVYSIIRN